MPLLLTLTAALYTGATVPEAKTDAGAEETNAKPNTSAAPIEKESTNNAPNRASEFSLEDQFRKQHCFKLPLGKPCVLLFADKNGSKQIEPWVLEISKRYKDQVDIEGIAVLKEVPSVFRPALRYFFREKVAHPVLLDWEGSVTAAYPCKPEEVALFVVAKDGAITETIYGSASAESIDKVCSALDALTKPDKLEERR